MREIASKRVAGIAAVLGLFTGLGAAAASSCCILPLALSIVGFSGAWLGTVGELGVYRPHFLTAATAALAVGWVLALGWRTVPCTPDGGCTRPARGWLTFSTLALSTLLVGMAAVWGWIEPTFMAALLRLTWGAA
jgi:mercuric ion transport protein